MIPKKIQIQGFLSYRDQVQISFEAIHLACISGPNGAGKSSILDAITWALFGDARGSNDAVINQNTDHAEIIFDFEYEKQLFRIQRAKTINKTQMLEFFSYHPSEQRWVPLTEHTLRETQDRIQSILRMDYATFTNAAFFLQGKADQFTQITAGKRKEILSNILGLEIWENYRASASENRRGLENEVRRFEGILSDVIEEISKEPVYQANLENLTQEIKTKRDLQEIKEKNLAQARQLEQARTNAQQQIQDLQIDLKEKEHSLNQLMERYSRQSSEQERLQKKVSDAETIQKNYKQWQAIRSDLDVIEGKSARYYDLDKKISDANQAINQEEFRLTTVLSNLEQEYNEIQLIKSDLPELQEKREQLQNTISLLQEEINQREAIIRAIEELQKQIAENETINAQLTEKNTELRNHLKEFRGTGPNCPFCNQPLTEEHRDKYEKQVLEEGLQRKNEIESREKIITQAKAELKKLRDQIEQINKKEQKKIEKQTEYSQLQSKIETDENKLTHWQTTKQEKYEETKSLVSDQNYAKDARLAIEELIPQIKNLAYDPETHQALKQKELGLRNSQQEFRELEKAQSALEPLTDLLHTLTQDIQKLKEESTLRETRLEKATNEYENLYANLPDIESLQSELDDLVIQIRNLDQRIGGEKQNLHFIEQKKEEQERLKRDIDDLKVQISRYQRLEEAFGKNGIPALLIEQALPEIEDHANQLLERLSNGTMSVRFETQSEYKDKKRQDKKETLDILINDASGKIRAYEMFSGGEAFRINFSIRLALSQVLANRSGARLQTLVIDEGFGSQDVEGRQRLIEAINQVKSDFAKILVITHLDELKDAFPARIEVEKTPQGSKAKVVVF